ncbi:hypothetical protein ANO14919_020340 [Xylariales sp. No.14919]|nr:hypothetical protein ANO14919_020340 [Xylariales sp. No.14919]
MPPAAAVSLIFDMRLFILQASIDTSSRLLSVCGQDGQNQCLCILQPRIHNYESSPLPAIEYMPGWKVAALGLNVTTIFVIQYLSHTEQPNVATDVPVCGYS